MKKNRPVLAGFLPALLIAQLIPLFGSAAEFQTDTVWRSLNGFKYADARGMITNAWKNRNQDKNPQAASVWFDITTFQKMVHLLDDEANTTPATPENAPVTDGMRIYYGSPSGMAKGHCNYSVVMVATRRNGINPLAISGANHLDYYGHDKNASLFKVDADTLHGIKTMKPWFFSRGERSYDLNFDNRPDKDCVDPNLLTGAKTYQMLSHFDTIAVNSRAEWYSLKQLRYIADSSQIKDPAKKVDGVRIYFARHPDHDTVGNTVYDNRSAFVVCITERRHFLIFWPIHRDKFICFMSKDALKNLILKRKNLKITSYDDIGGLDKGELCPDNCDPLDCQENSDPDCPPPGGTNNVKQQHKP